MSNTKLDNTNISKHLGQVSQYKSTYDPSLLVREPRQSNRNHLNITSDTLPFIGRDVWNAYEISGLTNAGMPVTGVCKIIYPASNDYIVESKSLKLYFNSFNMTKLGETGDEVLQNIEKTAEEDLKELLCTEVKVRVFKNKECLESSISGKAQDCYNQGFTTLESVYDHTEFNKEFTQYQEDPTLLEVVEGDPNTVYKYHTSLLKSNCRVTSQPDFGDAYITFQGSKTVTPESLLMYIVSFRDECHFHEEICETIYTRLWNLGIFTKLSVMCLYTRRGGIDICPERVSSLDLFNPYLGNTKTPHVKTPRQ